MLCDKQNPSGAINIKIIQQNHSMDTTPIPREVGIFCQIQSNQEYVICSFSLKKKCNSKVFTDQRKWIL